MRHSKHTTFFRGESLACRCFVTIDVVRFLAPVFLLIVLAALACGDDDDTPTPSPTLQPTATATSTPPPTRTPRPTRPPTPTVAPTPSPTLAPTPVPTLEPTLAPTVATIDLTGSVTRQGGFLLVRLFAVPVDLPEVTAYFTGGAYNMSIEGDHWYSFIGLPTWFTVGGYPVEVYTGDVLLASGSLSVTEGGFLFESFELPPSSVDLLTDTTRIDAERALVESIHSVFTPERYWSGPWVLPGQGTYSSNFGEQRSINGGPYSAHTGQDIANEEGTPLYASADGFAAMAQELYLYGNSVIVDHGVGVFSSYNHMQALAVAPGQYVEQGQLIGYMGQTGFVSGPHVHWEAIIHGVRVDPRHFLEAGINP